jgi:hypothetical protein
VRNDGRLLPVARVVDQAGWLRAPRCWSPGARRRADPCWPSAGSACSCRCCGSANSPGLSANATNRHRHVQASETPSKRARQQAKAASHSGEFGFAATKEPSAHRAAVAWTLFPFPPSHSHSPVDHHRSKVRQNPSSGCNMLLLGLETLPRSLVSLRILGTATAPLIRRTHLGSPSARAALHQLSPNLVTKHHHTTSRGEQGSTLP